MLWLAFLAALAFAAYVWFADRPEDLPWTDLDLAQPVGLFTGRKLAALEDEPERCRALLTRAGVRYERLEPRGEGACRMEDALRLTGGGALTTRLAPAAPDLSCPLAAAFALWQWRVVQPAAQEYLGTPLSSIRHFGTYSCRRLYGRSEGAWSEHATANAIDVAGFVLEDGRVVSVLQDWTGEGEEAAFLRAVRDGGCDLFATVLSPDYNEAHRDHLHLDQAARGATGLRGCR